VANRLISADSHVRVELAAVRERVPVPLRPAFDDAIALQAASEKELKGGKELDLSDWDMEAFRDPGYSDPVARLAAMDRGGPLLRGLGLQALRTGEGGLEAHQPCLHGSPE